MQGLLLLGIFKAAPCVVAILSIGGTTQYMCG